MVNVVVPPGAFLFVLIVSVELPEFTMEGGLNFSFAARGTLLTESVTVPENPWPAVTVIV